MQPKRIYVVWIKMQTACTSVDNFSNLSRKASHVFYTSVAKGTYALWRGLYGDSTTRDEIKPYYQKVKHIYKEFFLKWKNMVYSLVWV